MVSTQSTWGLISRVSSRTYRSVMIRNTARLFAKDSLIGGSGKVPVNRFFNWLLLSKPNTHMAYKRKNIMISDMRFSFLLERTLPVSLNIAKDKESFQILKTIATVLGTTTQHSHKSKSLLL